MKSDAENTNKHTRAFIGHNRSTKETIVRLPGSNPMFSVWRINLNPSRNLHPNLNPNPNPNQRFICHVLTLID